MERLLYWIRKFLNMNWKYCSKFCVTCQYYEICKKDDEFGQEIISKSGRGHRSPLPNTVREILLIGGVIFYGSVFDVGSVTDDNRFICIII